MIGINAMVYMGELKAKIYAWASPGWRLTFLYLLSKL